MHRIAIAISVRTVLDELRFVRGWISVRFCEGWLEYQAGGKRQEG